MEQDLYEIGAIDADNYKPDSKAIQAAKNRRLLSNIIIWYGVWSVILFLVWEWRHKYDFLDRWCTDDAVFKIIAGLISVAFGVWLFSMITVGKKLSKLSYEEKFDFDLYLYHKRAYKKKGARNITLLALAQLNAKMGDKYLCQKAIEKIDVGYQPKLIDKLKLWIKSEEEEIDLSEFDTKRKPKAFPILIFFLLIAHAFFFDSIAYPINIYYKIHKIKLLYGFLGILSMVGNGLSAIFIFVGISLIIHHIRYKDISNFKVCKPLMIVVSIIVAICVVISKLDIIDVALSSDSDKITSTGEVIKASDYEDSAVTYEYDYDYDDYNYDYEEEESSTEDIDIMNMMIVLCNYLQKEGIIPDFTVELDYSAKGRVKGTVAQDESYIYVLYDNDIKQDEDGNDCLELVLEAEPLDENGNSLGQTEAVLKGFYLVNLETKEVIDEHKTHW